MEAGGSKAMNWGFTTQERRKERKKRKETIIALAYLHSLNLGDLDQI